LWRILLLEVSNKCWFQLPEDGDVIAAKHAGAMLKIARVSYGIVHLLVLHEFFASSYYRG
jgi:hypothetical protein